MAGKIQPAADSTNDDFVQIKHLRKFPGQSSHPFLPCAIADDFIARFDGRGLVFNMSKDGAYLRHVLLHFTLYAADHVVRRLETQRFVEFKMLFQVQTAAQVLDAEIVHI